MNRKLIPAFVAVAFVVAGCSSPKTNKQAGKNVTAEQSAVSDAFGRLTRSQPIRSYDWSQVRQTLLDVQEIQATGAVSTTAGLLEGVGLWWWCPSIGAPVPGTWQLSPSTQYVDIPGDNSRELFPVDQGETIGAYIGHSNGTWTLCLDDEGRKFAKYHEGPVESTIAVISYPEDKRLKPEDVGFVFTERPK